jgi:hypothetical protein
VPGMKPNLHVKGAMPLVLDVIVMTILSAVACATEAQKRDSPSAAGPTPQSRGASRQVETTPAPLGSGVSQCVRFNICASFVRAVAVDSTPQTSGDYQVNVELMEPGRRALQGATTKFLGQKVCVYVGPTAVTAAEVRAIISSGYMHGQAPSLEAARALAAAIRTAPGAPCGLQDGP